MLSVKSYSKIIAAACAVIFFLGACQKEERKTVSDPGRPQRVLKAYFDKKYLLYRLPDSYYNTDTLNQSLPEDKNTLTLFNNTLSIYFKPLGFNDSLNLQYTHVYSKDCVYHTADTIWKYAEVCFPNTCLTRDYAYAHAIVHNSSNQSRQVTLRVFYQNTSYWWRGYLLYADGMDLKNYYGASATVTVTIAALSDTLIKIPYSIGPNPKHEFDYDPYKDPARPGNYEFALVAGEKATSQLLTNDIDKQGNPFSKIKVDYMLAPNRNKADYAYAYIGPHHFKFVMLDEYFDGGNDLNPNHVYIAKHGKEKKLCDTCSGWYRGVIYEHWNNDEYFKGFISKANFVKADYGIRRENCTIDSTGITLKIPASRRGDYNKTWGEVLFGPSFKYGHITVRAKFAPMHNFGATPNGIIHNLWLYQRDPDPVDTSNPFNHLRNWQGVQPYEIDFEIWSSQEGVNSMWDDYSFINYSIVDYMRDPGVRLRPGPEFMQFGKYKAERINGRQASIPSGNIYPNFFDSFHTYEMYWYPDRVRFLVDGQETALIDRTMASIPDKHMFLWIGSPLYQDGTYYAQSNIPFLKYPKQSIIDYIKIE